MTKTRLYIARHGKTMFNTIGRAQGWSDTPLTAEGERGIQALGIGLRESGLEFTRAYSSDSRKLGFLLKRLFRVILDAPFKPWELFFKNSV